MSWRQWLGLESGPRSEGRGGSRDTASVREIARQLEALPEQQARFLAAFAYVLARVAHADLRFEEAETTEMERAVGTLSELSSDECILVVAIAKSQTTLLGGTENYVVTRQFRELSDPAERAKLLGCLFAVAAADGTISPEESAEIYAIGDELGFKRSEVNAYRSRYRERLSEFQTKPGS